MSYRATCRTSPGLGTRRNPASAAAKLTPVVFCTALYSGLALGWDQATTPFLRIRETIGNDQNLIGNNSR